MIRARVLAAVTGAAAILTSLVACTSAHGPVATPVRGNASSPPTAPTAAPTRNVATMGADSITLDDLTFQLGKPTYYRMSTPPEAGQPESAVRFDVTVANIGTQPYTGYGIGLEVTIGGAQAQETTDIDGQANVIGGGSVNEIIPAGRPLTAKYLFRAATNDTSIIDVVITVYGVPGIGEFRGSVKR